MGAKNRKLHDEKSRYRKMGCHGYSTDWLWSDGPELYALECIFFHCRHRTLVCRRRDVERPRHNGRTYRRVFIVDDRVFGGGLIGSAVSSAHFFVWGEI